MGRYEEGYTELKRAIRLEPHWSLVHFGLAFVSWCGSVALDWGTLNINPEKQSELRLHKAHAGNGSAVVE